MRSVLLALVFLIGHVCLVQARLLKQDPVSFTDIQGQQPAGQWAITGHEAEAGAASGAKGVRYNDVSVQVAGDGTPGPLSLGVAGTELTNSGNTMAEPVTNLGREVVAATSEGARAVAGSGVSDTAEDPTSHPGRAFTGTSKVFTARHVNNKGSHAFTDNGGTSAATTGQGNGPAALAFGAEVGAFSRSHRNKGPGGSARDGFQ